MSTSNPRNLGVGLGFRRALADFILDHAQSIDFLEVTTEHIIRQPGGGLPMLDPLIDRFPIIFHGLNLSITMPILDLNYLSRIKTLVKRAKCPYYTEHLAVTGYAGLSLGHLFPVLLTEDVLNICIKNVLQIQDYLELPLVLENITYKFELPGASLTQDVFFNALVNETGCGILLDITNLHINASNHQFDPLKYLDGLPLDRVFHCHLSGGHYVGDKLIDSHGYPISDETWSLLNYLNKKGGARNVIIEQDQNYEDSYILLNQLAKAKELLS